MMTLDGEIDTLILRFSRALRGYIDAEGNTTEAVKDLVIEVRAICDELEAIAQDGTEN